MCPTEEETGLSMSSVYSVACIGGKRGIREWVLGPGKGLKMGRSTLSKGTARTGIRNYVQGATIPSKRGFLNTYNITGNIIIYVSPV
jgi:hypothetical protein